MVTYKKNVEKMEKAHESLSTQKNTGNVLVSFFKKGGPKCSGELEE